MRTTLAIATILSATFAIEAHASSDDAWGAFGKDVSKACITAAKGLIDNGKAVVDPFGSQSYGLAVVTGKAHGGKATVSAICAYDKKTKKAEVGGEIPGEQLIAKPAK
jgi:hypothetical protein